MKLKLYTNKEFSADFTVVSDDGVTGLVLDPTDTATFTVSSAGPNPTCVIQPVNMTIVDADNGLWNVTIPAADTAGLVQEIGGQEDSFNPLNTYTGFLDFTLVSGNRQATCPLFIIETGLCPVI